MSNVPTFDDDLDRVMDMGFGRRFIASIIRQANVENPFSRDALELAYHTGMRQFAMSLDARIKSHSPDKWLLMQREMIDIDSDVEKEPRHDDEP